MLLPRTTSWQAMPIHRKPLVTRSLLFLAPSYFSDTSSCCMSQRPFGHRKPSFGSGCTDRQDGLQHADAARARLQVRPVPVRQGPARPWRRAHPRRVRDFDPEMLLRFYTMRSFPLSLSVMGQLTIFMCAATGLIRWTPRLKVPAKSASPPCCNTIPHWWGGC